MKQKSLFDVISPIMVGPSSSHTAGAIRLGLLARNIYNSEFNEITFNLYNSYAKTGKGHGTDKGVLAGILGYAVDNTDIKNIFESDVAKKIKYKFNLLEDINRHPNAVDFIIKGKFNMEIQGDSIGAGEIRITNINGFSVKLSGEYNTLLLMYKDKPGMLSTVTGMIQDLNINVATLSCDRSSKGGDASMCIALDSEVPQEIVKKMEKLDDVYWVRNIKKLDC